VIKIWHDSGTLLQTTTGRTKHNSVSPTTMKYHLISVAFAVLCGAMAANAFNVTTLDENNYDELTKGKIVLFIKFFASWVREVVCVYVRVHGMKIHVSRLLVTNKIFLPLAVSVLKGHGSSLGTVGRRMGWQHRQLSYRSSGVRYVMKSNIVTLSGRIRFARRRFQVAYRCSCTETHKTCETTQSTTSPIVSPTKSCP